MNSSFSLRKVIGCVVLVLSTLFLADVMAAEPSGGGQQASSEWEKAMQALREENDVALRNVVMSNPKIVNEIVGKNSLLEMASYKGDMDAVRLLLINGADANVGDGLPLLGVLNGMTPLFGGISRGELVKYMEVMRLLLEEGANFNQRPYAGSNASLSEVYVVSLCEQGGQSDLYVEVLKDYGFEVDVEPAYRANYSKIAERAKDKYVSMGVGFDPGCVDYVFGKTGGHELEYYW
ncbi:hypothetical protein NPJ88_012740 [Halomonas elongata]|uniref:hypothetical protein n=1 Tax=Halomonas elongata TaxID=2746 RepID=UPI00255ABC50|nr:hypothetical protein [Halomonas elongata]MDL4863206.1 hypothetical protein [Halomonas elongata]